MLKVDYYDLPNGDKPVEIFINKLEPKMKAKVVGMIAKIKKKKPRLEHWLLQENIKKNMKGD